MYIIISMTYASDRNEAIKKRGHSIILYFYNVMLRVVTSLISRSDKNYG